MYTAAIFVPEKTARLELQTLTSSAFEATTSWSFSNATMARLARATALDAVHCSAGCNGRATGESAAEQVFRCGRSQLWLGLQSWRRSVSRSMPATA